MSAEDDKKNKSSNFERKIKALKELEEIGPCTNFCNFNDERIAVCKLCQKYLVTDNVDKLFMCYDTNIYNIKKYQKRHLNDIRVKYWLLFSSKVMTNESIGFPIVLRTIDTEKIYILLFENLKKRLYSLGPNVCITDKKTYSQIVFQKMYIAYQMYTHNCYSDILIFRIYNVPKTKIIFKVKDLFFEFEITKLVVLSEDTDFIVQHDIDESVYISKIVDNNFEIAERSNFIKSFVYTFGSNISLFYVILKIPPIIEEQKLTSFIRGEYACLKVRDNIISVIILNDYDDICEVLQISQGIFTLMNVNKDHLIRKPSILYSKNAKTTINYIIGEDVI